VDARGTETTRPLSRKRRFLMIANTNLDGGAHCHGSASQEAAIGERFMLQGTIGFVMIVWLSGQSEKPQQLRWQTLRRPSRETKIAQNDQLDRQPFHPILKLAGSSPRSNVVTTTTFTEVGFGAATQRVATARNRKEARKIGIVAAIALDASHPTTALSRVREVQ
jgi:hypothetical protein